MPILQVQSLKLGNNINLSMLNRGHIDAVRYPTH